MMCSAIVARWLSSWQWREYARAKGSSGRIFDACTNCRCPHGALGGLHVGRA